MTKRDKENKKYYDYSVGDCLRFTKTSNKRVFKSKYKTPEDAKTAHYMLLSIGVANKNHKPYKCPVCKMWHIGSPEDAEK